MMFNFQALHDKTMTIAELAEGVTVADLHRLSDESVDEILRLIGDCTDEDVVFQPIDPEANDPYAADESDKDIAWTLGHVVVHCTASAEESAALAAEQARGVEYHGRSRYETPWEAVTTIAQCRERLEESRRMRHASLEMWPHPPHLENVFASNYWGEYNAVGRFLLGLSHEYGHLAQIEEIVRQTHVGKAL
jgi:hypothetical protein